MIFSAITAASLSPAIPPKQFDVDLIRSNGSIQGANATTGSTRIRTYAPYSSSSRAGSIANKDCVWLTYIPATAADISLDKSISEFLSTNKYVNAVSERNPTDNLYEIRRLTGYNWNELSELLEVDRRTLHNWVKGQKIRNANRLNIADVLRVLRWADSGDSELLKKALHTRTQSGQMAFEAIKRKQFAIAKQCLGPGKSHKLEVSAISGLAGISTWSTHEMFTHGGAMHNDDEGDDAIIEPSIEPKLKSKSRRNRRT